MAALLPLRRRPLRMARFLVSLAVTNTLLLSAAGPAPPVLGLKTVTGTALALCRTQGEGTESGRILDSAQLMFRESERERGHTYTSIWHNFNKCDVTGSEKMYM